MRGPHFDRLTRYIQDKKELKEKTIVFSVSPGCSLLPWVRAEEAKQAQSQRRLCRSQACRDSHKKKCCCFHRHQAANVLFTMNKEAEDKMKNS